MLLVNYMRLLLLLLDKLFVENKDMESIIFMFIIICLQNSIDKNGVSFQPKTVFISTQVRKNIREVALGGLLTFPSIVVDVTVKIGVGTFLIL